MYNRYSIDYNTYCKLIADGIPIAMSTATVGWATFDTTVVIPSAPFSAPALLEGMKSFMLSAFMG